MAEHHFHLKAQWQGGRLGEGTIASGQLESKVSVPQELGGPGTGTNPEEMLLGAICTCYIITLAAVIENRKLPLMSLELSSDLVVNNEGGQRVDRIVHRPQIVLAAGATPEQVDTAHKAAERAEQACMISKAVRGNVEVTVEASVIVTE